MRLRRTREWLLIAVVALTAAAAGFGYNAWRTVPGEPVQSGEAALTAVTLPDLDGAAQSLGQ